MLKIAFKNLLRNLHRTLLTIIIIVVSTAGMIFGISWFAGEEALFIESGKKITGDIRITNQDYEIRSKTMDISSNFSYNNIEKTIEESEFQGEIVKRIKFGGLVYFNEKHETAMGNGIINLDEKYVGFNEYIYQGKFLENDEDIIVGETLKRKLGLELGDTVTILTQTAEKSLYSLNYKVTGFYKMDNSRLNRSFYITLSSSQYLLDMEDRVTELLLFSKNEKDMEKVYDSLSNNGSITTKLDVKKWDEIGMNESVAVMMPFVKLIFILIFSTLSGLGISNTMLMIVFERRHEIGLLKSLGVREFEIKKLFLLEEIYMGIIGSIIGIAIGSTLSLYLGHVGVDFGNTMESITDELNLKGVIYPMLTVSTVLLTFIVAILTSTIATITAISKEVKKEAITNMRNI